MDLSLPGVDSLKEKRRKIKPLLSRLQSRFKVSIAEVDFNDNLRQARIGAAVVSRDAAFADRMLARIVRAVDSDADMIMTDYRTEIL